MAVNPWLTSDDLVAAVQRKISFPLSQITFTEDDILAFANEEMEISQVPSVLQFHEEFYVTRYVTPLVVNQVYYPIPDRAIGMRLRDVFYMDDQGNQFDMTRINADDQAYFQANTGNNNGVFRFYLEGNSIVLSPTPQVAVTGSILMTYFIRPNQLVPNSNASYVSGFQQTVTVDNATLTPFDTIQIGSITYTAVVSGAVSPQFNIGVTSILTANNLVAAINSNTDAVASNGSGTTAVITLNFPTRQMIINPVTFNVGLGLEVPLTFSVVFTAITPNITNGSIIDFLQTKPGHMIRGFSITIPSMGINNNVITFAQKSDVPDKLIIGDYICNENNAIIPFIPPELHSGLAERTCARILAALGDQAGLQASNQKLQEISNAQNALLDNRVDGAPQKVLARHSLLRYGRFGIWRKV